LSAKNIPPFEKGGLRGFFQGDLKQIPLKLWKKFRPEEFGQPGDARGRKKFTAPKQAVISPWPGRYLFRGSRNDHPLGFIRFF
jgi:hypothetical protein